MPIRPASLGCVEVTSSLSNCRAFDQKIPSVTFGPHVSQSFSRGSIFKSSYGTRGRRPIRKSEPDARIVQKLDSKLLQGRLDRCLTVFMYARDSFGTFGTMNRGL
jgi:hypothetical protein